MAGMTELTSALPHLNALLNSASAILLIAGYVAIKSNSVEIHRACQLSAFATSVLFLASYITYHSFHGVTHFAEPGVVKVIYLLILGTHTVLAVVIVPLI